MTVAGALAVAKKKPKLKPVAELSYRECLEELGISQNAWARWTGAGISAVNRKATAKTMPPHELLFSLHSFVSLNRGGCDVREAMENLAQDG